MYIQGKITGQLDGAPARDFQALQGLSDLKDAVLSILNNNIFLLGNFFQIKHQLADHPSMQRLVVDLSGPISPEDSFSPIPYMKGQNFLRYLEDLLGGPTIFDPFLRSYFAKYAYKSIVTDDFKSSLTSYFNASQSSKLSEIDWPLWLYGAGLPPIVPVYDNSLAEASLEHATLWSNGTLAEIEASTHRARPLSSLQRVELLNQLLAKENIVALSAEWILLLEQSYALGAAETKNCDIRARFIRLCIRARLLDRIPEILTFANSNFRMKYVRPVYRDFAGWPEAKMIAVNNFLSVKHQMMAVCSNQVAKDLGI